MRRNGGGNEHDKVTSLEVGEAILDVFSRQSCVS